MKLTALFMTFTFGLLSADGPQPDRWHNLVLSQTSSAEAIKELGASVADKDDRLFLRPINKWFESGLNHKALRKISFKDVEGFSEVDLYFREDKLAVIQLTLAKGIEPTALPNVYGLKFEPYIDGIFEAMNPSNFERNQGKVYPKTYPSEYALVAVSEKSVVSAHVTNNGFGAALRQSNGIRDTAGAGFPGKVKLIQLISRDLDIKGGASADLLK